MTEESAIVEWLKKEGDQVAKGDILFTVETDKVGHGGGEFRGRHTAEDRRWGRASTVPVQSVVGFLGKPGEAVPGAAAPRARRALLRRSRQSRRPRRRPRLRRKPLHAVPAPRSGRPRAVPHQSARGGIGRSDAELTRRRSKAPARWAAWSNAMSGNTWNRAATPAPRQPARRNPRKLLLARPFRRVNCRERAAEKPKAMSKMRQIIAQRLTQSFRDTPHFYVTVSVDMTGLIAYRHELKAAGATYTLTDFISQSVVLSLLEFPDVNSSTDGKTTLWHSQVNLGLAVSIEGGLVVPVIHNAGTLTLREISAASKRLADKARAGKLTPDEMTGGTFTISNMGMLNVENFSAIINPGEGGILAVASALPQPAVRDGQVVIRQIMKMTLSVDHRLVDGALGAQFLNAVKARLEDLQLWKRLSS